MLWSGQCPRYHVTNTWENTIDFPCPGGATMYSRGASIGSGSVSPAATSAHSRYTSWSKPGGPVIGGMIAWGQVADWASRRISSPCHAT